MKRAYALFAMKHIVIVPPSGHLPPSYLSYVEDVDSLKNKAWARMAMDSLVKGIRIYKNAKESQKERNLGGCVLFYRLVNLNIFIPV